MALPGLVQAHLFAPHTTQQRHHRPLWLKLGTQPLVEPNGGGVACEHLPINPRGPKPPCLLDDLRHQTDTDSVATILGTHIEVLEPKGYMPLPGRETWVYEGESRRMSLRL